MKNNYRIMCALIAWIVLSLRFVDMLIIGEQSSIAETLFVYFGYFTVWANMLIALAFTAPLLNPDRKLSNFFILFLPTGKILTLIKKEGIVILITN